MDKPTTKATPSSPLPLKKQGRDYNSGANMAGRPPTFLDYAQEFRKRLSKDSWEWVRDNIAVGVLMLVVPPVVALLLYGISPEWKIIWVTLVVYALVFLVYVAFHFVRTPWKLHKERAEKIADLEKHNLELQEAVNELTWPADRPRLSFQSWGRAPLSDSAIRHQSGFYFSNDGDAALDVSVEKFSFGDFSACGAANRIQGKSDGFCPVWIEEEPELSRWGLNAALSIAWAGSTSTEDIDYKMHVPVSAIHKDFNNNWYRTRSTLVFDKRGEKIEFLSSTQERMTKQPE